MVFIVDPVHLVFMSAAKRQTASIKTITWRVYITHLNRILFICDIYELYGIAIIVAVIAVEGIDNFCLLLYGTAVGGKYQRLGPVAEMIVGKNALHLCLVLRAGGQVLDGIGTIGD